MSKTIKRFYGLANRRHNEWNGVFATQTEAQYQLDRKHQIAQEDLSVEVVDMTHYELDMTLEGEGTDEVWENAVTL